MNNDNIELTSAREVKLSKADKENIDRIRGLLTRLEHNVTIFVSKKWYHNDSKPHAMSKEHWLKNILFDKYLLDEQICYLITR